MVGRYISLVCLCVLDALHDRKIDYVTLSSTAVIDNYSELCKNCSCCTDYTTGMQVCTVKSMRSNYWSFFHMKPVDLPAKGVLVQMVEAVNWPAITVFIFI